MLNTKLAIVMLMALPFSLFAQKGKTLHIGMVSGSNEYVSHITLNEYKRYLENVYSNVKISLLQAEGPINEKDEFSTLKGTEILKDCDVLLIFVRRSTISGQAIEDIKNYVNSGKPFVALRTASHGFQSWPEFDKEVLGGNYHGHFFGEPEKRFVGADGMRYVMGETTGPTQKITVNPDKTKHPVLKGIPAEFYSKYSLYNTGPIAGDTELLLTGTIQEGSEPVAWTRSYKGGRLVYIALGGVQDWANPVFRKLVTNSLFWTANFKGKINK